MVSMNVGLSKQKALSVTSPVCSVSSVQPHRELVLYEGCKYQGSVPEKRVDGSMQEYC